MPKEIRRVQLGQTMLETVGDLRAVLSCFVAECPLDPPVVATWEMRDEGAVIIIELEGQDRGQMEESVRGQLEFLKKPGDAKTKLRAIETALVGQLDRIRGHRTEA